MSWRLYEKGRFTPLVMQVYSMLLSRSATQSDRRGMQNLSSTIRRAIKAAAARDLDQAISILKKALNICSSDEEASVLLTNISLLYHQKADWEKALNYADHVGCTSCSSFCCNNIYPWCSFASLTWPLHCRPCRPGPEM